MRTAVRVRPFSAKKKVSLRVKGRERPLTRVPAMQRLGSQLRPPAIQQLRRRAIPCRLRRRTTTVESAGAQTLPALTALGAGPGPRALRAPAVRDVAHLLRHQHPTHPAAARTEPAKCLF